MPRPRYPCLFPTWSTAILLFFLRATPVPPAAPHAPFRSPAAYSLCAVCPPAVLVVFSSCPPPPFPAVLPALWYPPPCMHARQHCTGHRVTVPLCSPVPLPSWGVPLGGPRPCQVDAPPSRPSPLFPLFSPLPSPPLPCLFPALLLLLSCSVCSLLVFPTPGLYLAPSHAPSGLRPVLRPVGRLGRPPEIPLQGDSPVVRPAGLPSISSLMVGRGGRYGSMRVIGMAVLCARCGVPLCRCWPPASPPLPCGTVPLVLLLFSLGCLSCHAHCCSRAPCVCPLLLSAFPLPRRPVPSPPLTPFSPSSPPILCHSDGPVCTFPSAVSAVAMHSPACATCGFYLCPSLLSLPFPLVLGRTLTLPTLMCYCPQPLCYALLPGLSPHPERHGFTARGSVYMRTGLRSCLWMDEMMGC